MTDHSDKHLKKVAKGGALGLVGAGFSGISGFLLVGVVTNMVSLETSGHLFTLTSAFLLVSSLCVLGADTGLARFLLRFEKHERHADIPGLIRVAAQPVALVTFAAAGITFGFANPLADLLSLDPSTGPSAVRVMALVLPAAVALLFFVAGSLAFGSVRGMVLVDQTLRPTLQLVAVWVAAATGAGLVGLTWAWSLTFVAAAPLAGVMFLAITRRRREGYPESTARQTSPRTLAKEFWAFAWPRSITRMAQMAIQRLDIVLIAALSTAANAALYTAATRFIVVGQMANQAIQQVLLPRFATLIAEDDIDSLRRVYQLSTAWSMALSWPVYVGVAGCVHLYLRIFGTSYDTYDTTLTVLIMAVAMMISVAVGPADSLLLMAGRSGLSLANTFIALVIDVVGCIVLIPLVGLWGAAIAWALAVATRGLLGLLQIRFLLRIGGLGTPVLIVMAAVGGTIALPLGVANALGYTSWSIMLPLLGVCAIAYTGVLLLARRPLALDSFLPGLASTDKDTR